MCARERPAYADVTSRMVASRNRGSAARADIEVTIFPGCVFLSIVHASKLGESGESLRNSIGRYPRSLFRAVNAKGDPSCCWLVDSKMQN